MLSRLLVRILLILFLSCISDKLSALIDCGCSFSQQDLVVFPLELDESVACLILDFC